MRIQNIHRNTSCSHSVGDIYVYIRAAYRGGSSVSNTNYGELLNFINYNTNKNGFFSLQFVFVSVYCTKPYSSVQIAHNKTMHEI